MNESYLFLQSLMTWKSSKDVWISLARVSRSINTCEWVSKESDESQYRVTLKNPYKKNLLSYTSHFPLLFSLDLIWNVSCFLSYIATPFPLAENIPMPRACNFHRFSWTFVANFPGAENLLRWQLRGPSSKNKTDYNSVTTFRKIKLNWRISSN